MRTFAKTFDVSQRAYIKAKDWVLVYKEFYETKEDAMIRERKIMSWKSAGKIQELISSTK